MNVNVEMTEQEFDSFRQWRGKLEELDANRLYDSLTSEIMRHCPRDIGLDGYNRLKAVGDGLHSVLKHWMLCHKNRTTKV